MTAYPRPRPGKCNEPTPTSAPIVARCSLPAEHTLDQHLVVAPPVIVKWPKR